MSEPADETHSDDLWRTAALEAFQPLVLHFSSSTPQHVNLDAVLETFTRDSALRDRFFVVDARAAPGLASNACGSPAANAHARGGKGAEREKPNRVGGGTAESPKRGTAGSAAAGNDAAASFSQFVRDEYERLAFSRETARREAAAAKARRLEALKQQYLEDGLTEEEALNAAVEDLRENEDESSSESEGDDGNTKADVNTELSGEIENTSGADGAAEGGAQSTGRPRFDHLPIPSFPGSAAISGAKRRESLYFCIFGGFPNSLDDVKDLFAHNVNLHVVVDVVSKVPLTGSTEKNRGEQGEKPRSRADARAPPSGNAAQGKRGGNAANNTSSSANARHSRLRDGDNDTASLAEKIAQHQKQCACGGCATCCAVGEVLLYAVEFPTEASPNAQQGESPEYRLVVPEKVVLNSIKESVAVLEERLHLYRALTAERRIVPVPAYTPLPNPDVQVPPTTIAAMGAGGDDKDGENGSASRANNMNRRSTTPTRKMSPGPRASISAGALVGETDANGQPLVGTGEPPAAAVTTAPRPRRMSKVAARTVEYEAVRDTLDATTRSFVTACIRQADSSVNLRTPATRVPTPAFVEEGTDEVSLAPSPEPQLLLSEEAASLVKVSKEKEAVVQYAYTVLSALLGESATPAGATDPDREAKTAEKVKESRSDLQVDTKAIGGQTPVHEKASFTTLRRAMERVARALFPHLPRSLILQHVNAVLKWAVVCDTPSVVKQQQRPNQEVSTLLGALCKPLNMMGWLQESATVGLTPGTDLTVFSRGDGEPRCQQSVYTFDSATTFPLFVRYLDYCADAQGYFYPPPPPSDADDDPPTSASSASESESETEESDSDNENNEEKEQSGDAGEHSADGDRVEKHKGRRKKRVPTPPPPPPLADHFRIIQTLARRRRLFEEVKKRYSSAAASRSELVTSGEAAHGAACEVEWAFPADGCTVEVARTSANTKESACTITAPCYPPVENYELGYVFDESAALPPLEGASCAAQVPALVRSFLRCGNTMQLLTEVVADNSLAAERDAYAKATETARATARAQFEALQVATRGKSSRGTGGGGSNSRDKNNAVNQPTLAEMEEAAVATVPIVVERAKKAPHMIVSMLFRPCSGDSHCSPVTGKLLQSEGVWEVGYDSAADGGPGGCPVAMNVTVWCPQKDTPGDVNSGHEETRRLKTVSKARYHAKNGYVELTPSASDALAGYCIVLTPHGACAAVDTVRGTVLVTAPNGEKSLYELPTAAKDKKPADTDCVGSSPFLVMVRKLPPVMCATHQSAGATQYRVHRSDGAALEYETSVESASSALTKATFGPNVTMTVSDDPVGLDAQSSRGDQPRTCYTWCLGSEAAGRIQWSSSRQWISFLPALASANCGAVTYKHPEQAVIVTDRRSNDVAFSPDAQGAEAEQDVAPRITAALDLRRYRLECFLSGTPSLPLRSWYVVDCAFGGCYGESVTAGTSATSVMRVSPWGRLSFESRGEDGTTAQVFPTGYADAVSDPVLLTQPLILITESLSPAFAAVLDGSGIALDAKHAVHLNERPSSSFTELSYSASTQDAETALFQQPTGLTAIQATVRAHELQKTRRAMRDLLPALANSPNEDDPSLRTLLACTCLVPAASQNTGPSCVSFIGPQLSRSVVEHWCRHAVTSSDLWFAPTSQAECRSNSDRTQVEPQLAAQHNSVVREYELAGSSRVLVAMEDASVDSVGQWWDQHLASVGQLPRKESGAAAANRRPQEEQMLAVASEITAQAEAEVPVKDPTPSTTVDAPIRGRLNYWTSTFAPSHDTLPRYTATHPTTGPQTKRTSPSSADTPEISASVATGRSSEMDTVAADAEGEQAAADTTERRTRTGPPLMYLKMSQSAPATQSIETTPYHHQLPSLAFNSTKKVAEGAANVPPPSVDFGDVAPGRRYASSFTVTNTSTVPCRYRVSVPKSLKGGVSVSYPHRFLAAGMADTVTVTLSGCQPAADGVAGYLSVTHEGANLHVAVTWRTTHAHLAPASSSTRHAAKVSAKPATNAVVCLGESLPTFQPGCTFRPMPGEDDISSEDGDAAVATRIATRKKYAAKLQSNESGSDTESTDGGSSSGIAA